MTPAAVTGAVGSLSAFLPLIEPVLDRLGARRVCEVGVENGAFSRQLLEWCAPRGSQYCGIDPAPQQGAASLDDVIVGRSLDVLPDLEPCDAYFIDGDHNYYTVRNELDVIARTTRRADAGPAVFVHDVSWPWGRRDLYYRLDDIPDDARHPYSETLGVAFDRDELVDGGLRAPGRYAIACRSGGERNGVLTAVEDFLGGEAGASWTMLLVPAAYGLGVVYQPERLPESCRRHLDDLRDATRRLAPFLRVLETSYVQLYLFGEEMKRYADGLQQHADKLDRHVVAQDGAYESLLSHTNALQAEYEKLFAHFQHLQSELARTR